MCGDDGQRCGLFGRTCGGRLEEHRRIRANWKIDREFTPALPEEKRQEKMKGWKKAVRYAFDWAKEE